MTEEQQIMADLAKQAEQKGQRYVVCAAMRHRVTGRIILGIRHYCPVMRQEMIAAEGINHWKSNCDQGFADNFGQFLTREEALKLAVKQGQIRSKEQPDTRLYSEDLY